MDLFAQLQQALSGNQFLSGGLVLGLLGAVAMAMRQLPGRVWQLLRGKLITTVEVTSQDELYGIVLEWLSKHPYSARSRRLSAALDLGREKYEEEEKATRKTVKLAPSPGDHFLRVGGKFFWFRREREKMNKDSGMVSLYESLTITALGRDREQVLEILCEAIRQDEAKMDGQVTLRLATEYGDWERMGGRLRRPFESVVLADGVGENLLNDVREFLASRQWYLDHGVPYHRGYLLYGPPGNGKTSSAFALASELKMGLCVLSLSHKKLGDRELARLMANVPLRHLVVIEDIDCAVNGRAVARASGEENLTFSGLLNALDGLCSSEGNIVIMTTNHREKLDPALIRPGRVDMQVEFANATEDQARRLCEKFLPGDAEFAREFGKKYQGRPMAELQGILLGGAEAVCAGK